MRAEERDEFITVASHELMTPVTSMKLQAQLMQRALAHEPEESRGRMTAMLELFDRQLSRLTQLCDELLWATSIQSSELSLVREEVDLGELVRHVVEGLISQRPEARDLMTVHVEGTPMGRWDRAQLERLLVHLLKNAVTYGEGKPIAVEVIEAVDGARLSVRDQGMGIAEADQSRIFERFERAVPASHFGGLGLGLYIARAIVQAHGGSIRVESAVAEGATFLVELPAETAALGPHRASHARPKVNRRSRRLPRFRRSETRRTAALRVRSRAF
jgi:two-component system, OmpR family, sensor histidine kinase SenX3